MDSVSRLVRTMWSFVSGTCAALNQNLNVCRYRCNMLLALLSVADVVSVLLILSYMPKNRKGITEIDRSRLMHVSRWYISLFHEQIV